MKLPSKEDVTRRAKQLLANPVLKNVAIVASLSFCIKLIAFYKETLVASTFGLSEILDTFFIAILIPSFIQNVFIGALNNIFIPSYIAEINSTKNKAQFQSLVFLIVSGIMLFFSTLTYLVADVLVEFLFPGKDLSYYELIRQQLYIVLPSLFFMGFSTIIGGLLEINNRFLVSTLSGFFPAFSTIIALLFFSDYFGNLVLSIGFLAGSLMGFIYLLVVGIHYHVIALKKPKINSNSATMLRQLPAKIISGFLTGVNPFVDQFFAAQLAIGSIAAINYGVKIPSFIMGILLLAIGNVLLPHFSKLVTKNLLNGFHYLFNTVKILFLTSLGLVLILMLFSENIIELLFERKSFSPEDTKIVSLIQIIILAYVPFSLTGIIMVKFLTSINKNSFMAYISIVSFSLNIILNFILVDVFNLYGLALSTTIVRITISCIYFVYTYKLFKKHQSEANP